MATRPISVSQLNGYIQRVLQNDTLLMNIAVTGEISNLKYHSSGHVYFSLSDEGAKVNCFLPANIAANLRYRLGDGLEITATGSINVYKKGGYYSLFVRLIDVAGEGNLSAAFQLMKEKLDKEGLFDSRHKKPIPTFPHHIGIVTAETGAAVEDIIKIIRRRNEMVDITVFPVPVQGEGAADSIAEMLDLINAKFSDVDTLIVGRGGGSAEDLWAFNEEVLARAIFRSRIPVISAVGHEIDFTISDFVADRRAETPTAAAEIAVPDINDLKLWLSDRKENFLSELNSRLRLAELKAESMLSEMRNGLHRIIERHSFNIEKMKVILEESNPIAILEKGYSIIENVEGSIIGSSNDLTDGEYIIRFKDGRKKVSIKNV